MANYTVPTAEQKQLCRDCGINPEGMAVILENDSILAMLHLKTRNEVTITKGELQKRREQHGNQ